MTYIYVTLTIFWPPQLHSLCVRDTQSSKNAYILNIVQLRCFPLLLKSFKVCCCFDLTHLHALSSLVAWFVVEMPGMKPNRSSETIM